MTFQNQLSHLTHPTEGRHTPVLRNVEAGFEGDDLTTCTVGAYDSGNDETPVTCTGFTQDTTTSSAFHVAVHN